MHRRSFLGALLAAPIAVPVVAKAMAAEPKLLAINGGGLEYVLGQTKPVLGLARWEEFKSPDGFRAVEFRVDYPALVMEEAYASRPLDEYVSFHISPSETFGG